MRVARCSALLLAAAAACATAPASRPPPEDGAARLFQATSAAGSEGGYESGRVTRTGIAGPFVLTYLTPGEELEIVAAAGPIGRVRAPLAQPFHLAAGMRLAAPDGGAPETVYAGYRPMPMTRPLEAWIGRQILVAVPGAQPEQWWLREVGSDHLTVERSRTYRVIPLRRVGEITWTELTGIDPTPRVTLGPE
ncbi:hypothetical protein [Anaeromyxobacter oryzae]|uniref:Lipoprotein n=1 Tax=Anaeromyxobacter oryzae TaxID=2918170 RepID=A0ABM7WW13_9BACT|nr:hypothetical protein [Anaeromyxobacter oryzae]BDG03654.1 hypothetical protein AMOR_26500 [Anaeromyxobacter oryzae]